LKPLKILFVNARRFKRAAKDGELGYIWYYPNRKIHLLSLATSAPPPVGNLPPDVPINPDADDKDNPLHEALKHMPAKFHKFSKVFSPTAVDELPPHRPYNIAINVEDGKTPPFGPIYSLLQPECAELFKYTEANLAKGFICRSESPAASPIIFVKKKTGELCLCVDYRKLNNITRKNRYPLPLVADLLNCVQGCKHFTALYLKNAYNLVRVRKGDEWKTAFRTHLGLFEYMVMLFGLTNAPAVFQAFIQDMLHELLDISCVVYLNNILIFSRTQAEHNINTHRVLERLQAAGLYANAKKCEFNRSKVAYLGYIIGVDGVKMDLKKLDTIRDWPKPHLVWDIQSFLGFTNFY
jgi:hypothetical protein